MAMRSVGESIATFLSRAHAAEPKAFTEEFPARFAMLSTGEMARPGFGIDQTPGGDSAGGGNLVSLLLHRVSISEHLRSARPQLDRPAALPVELHFLLTVWAATPAAETVLLAWALRALHDNPLLSATTLDPNGGWAADEVVHFVPDEISSADMMRIWDALAPSYRLSFAYVARVVRIESESHRPGG